MLLPIVLAVATMLVALVAGIVLCFAVVVMPGTARLDDRGFLRAFQVMDRIIQDGHPVFMLVWAGSIFSVLAALTTGYAMLAGTDFILLLAAGLLFLFGVQLPTVRFNIPLNNHLQSLDLDSMNASELANERLAFEPVWNRWNRFRTVVSCACTLLFLWLLTRI